LEYWTLTVQLVPAAKPVTLKFIVPFIPVALAGSMVKRPAKVEIIKIGRINRVKDFAICIVCT
jgi:hypothetical protein